MSDAVLKVGPWLVGWNGWLIYDFSISWHYSLEKVVTLHMTLTREQWNNVQGHSRSSTCVHKSKTPI